MRYQTVITLPSARDSKRKFRNKTVKRYLILAPHIRSKTYTEGFCKMVKGEEK